MLDWRKIFTFITEYRILLSILTLALFARALFLYYDPTLWWDAAVYLGMAKHLALGTGLWENVRPLLWPWLISLGIRTGMNGMLFAHTLGLFFTLANIILVYLLANTWLNNKHCAHAAAFIFAFTPILLFWTPRLYTETPATFFLLLAFFYAQRQPLISGTLLTLAILTRYPLIFFAPPLLIYILASQREHIRNTILFIIPPACTLLAILLLFQHWYNDPFQPLRVLYLSTSWSANPIFISSGPFFYTRALFFTFNFTLPPLILGTYWIVHQRRKQLIFGALIPTLISLALLALLSIKEERYLIPTLPFLAIMASAALLHKTLRAYLHPLLLIFFVLSTILALTIVQQSPAAHNQDISTLYTAPTIRTTCPYTATMASTNPAAVAIYNTIITYYGSYDFHLINNVNTVTCVFTSSCDGTTTLPPQLTSKFIVIYNATRGSCTDVVYAKQKA